MVQKFPAIQPAALQYQVFNLVKTATLTSLSWRVDARFLPQKGLAYWEHIFARFSNKFLIFFCVKLLNGTQALLLLLKKEEESLFHNLAPAEPIYKDAPECQSHILDSCLAAFR